MHNCDTDRLFTGQQQRQNHQGNQSIREVEDLDIKVDAMGQLPTPVKSAENHSQSVNETVDVDQTSDDEKKEG